MTLFAGIVEALHTVIKRDRLIPKIREIIVEILRQSENTPFGDTSLRRIPVYVQHISFHDNQRLYSAEYSQLPMPLCDIIGHCYLPTFSAAESSFMYPNGNHPI